MCVNKRSGLLFEMKIVSMFNVELMKKKILTAEFGLMTVVIRTEKCHWLGIVQYKVFGLVVTDIKM